MSSGAHTLRVLCRTVEDASMYGLSRSLYEEVDAIWDATGVRIRRVPFRPEWFLPALRFGSGDWTRKFRRARVDRALPRVPVKKGLAVRQLGQ